MNCRAYGLQDVVCRSDSSLLTNLAADRSSNNCLPIVPSKEMCAGMCVLWWSPDIGMLDKQCQR